MSHRILIVEDDEDICEILRYNLEREGFTVAATATGEDGLAHAREQLPDLILLDLMLPGIQGLEVCRRLRRLESTANVPLIIVSAKGEEADVVAGLEMGADDFVTKPFSPRELVARVRSVLRRGRGSSETERESPTRVGPLQIDPGRHEVSVDDAVVELTAAEFRLLQALAASVGRVFTRVQLVDCITGGGHHIVERNVDVHVRALRKKLAPYGEIIRTVRGVGYKLDPD
jgi:two-component system phosphate regulon response regulator PhoB